MALSSQLTPPLNSAVDAADTLSSAEMRVLAGCVMLLFTAFLHSSALGYRILSWDDEDDDESASDSKDQLASSKAGNQRLARTERHANLALSHNISAVLENLLKDYDHTIRPGASDGPTLVRTNMLIRSIGPISELNMEYSMDCYFRQMWRDERLSFNSSIDQLSLSITMLEGIWKPDTYFLNGRGSYVHTITRPNKLIRLARDGSILYSMRLTIKAKCPMLLQRFPMDQQTCPLTIGSYAYNIGELVFSWDVDRNVSLEPGIGLSQFDLISYPVRNSTVQRRTGASFDEIYSVLQVRFNLQRHTGYFLIQVYVPCILIVVLSWVSFWINREATADRVGLGITSVLTMSTISIDTRTSLPKVEYATAMDWFLLTSFGFIMATLLEFASVHYFTKVGSSGETLSVVRTPAAPILSDCEHEDTEWMDVGVVEESPLDDDSMYVVTRVWRPHIDGATSAPPHCQAEVDSDTLLRLTSADICGTDEYLPPAPPPPTAVRVGTAGTGEPCWYQVLYCLLGSVEYRRRRQATASDINSVSQIDRASRLLFPLLFILLNLFYWNLYWSEPPSSEW